MEIQEVRELRCVGLCPGYRTHAAAGGGAAKSQGHWGYLR